MSRGGYPPEWFAQPLVDSLICGICNKVLREPIVTPCGHIYCCHCVFPWVERYGVCPKRCEEVELESLRLRVQLEKFISGLYTHCKNKRAGCTEQVPLVDKHLHEKHCSYSRRSGKPVSRSVSNSGAKTVVSIPVSPWKNRHKRTQSSVSATFAVFPTATISAAAKRSPSAALLCRVKSKLGSRESPTACKMNSKEVFTTHTFRLKRTKAREPLGLVLVCGEKTPDGRPKSFYVKEVHPDTLGWKAGVLSKDRIVQVDFHDLASINPQEAVARIKEKTLVTITVLRGSNPLSSRVELGQQGADSHVYDEILYSDCSQNLSQNLSQGLSQGHSQGYSQQDENSLINGGSTMASNHFPLKSKPGKSSSEDKGQRLRMQQQLSPSSMQQQLSSSSMQLPMRDRTMGDEHAKAPRERGSKDSGLSSGSSTHQDDVEPSQNLSHGGEIHNHQVRRTGSGGSGSYLPERQASSIHCRIDGDYEIEDIYLQKNGTSQLGITLGYHTETKAGGLHVCEVVPSGLAAQNGRLRSGDIIQRVNGFEVHDPEEAILLFLEQDQDITLTVARPLKMVSGRRRGTSPRITTTPPRSFGSTPHTPTTLTGPFPNDLGTGHNYAMLEKPGVLDIRRVDSCGTLDSQKSSSSHHSQNRNSPVSTFVADSPVPTFVTDNDPDVDRPLSRTGYEKMRRTKSTGSSSSWSSRRRDVQLKSASPPALTRQPSPLVNHQHHPHQQLEQPVYQVLEPSSPIYHTLQSPPPPQPLPTHPQSPFQHEPFKQFSDQPMKSPKAAMFASFQQLTVGRPASAGPQSQYRIDKSSARERFDTRNNHHHHMHGTPPPFRSITNEIKSVRPETVPVDYRTESLV